MYWPRKCFIVFDTETTGLDFQKDRIIQVGVAVFNQEMYIHGWKWLLNTTYPSDADAVAVHGITDTHRYAEGESAHIVIPRVLGLFKRMRAAHGPVVAFNAPFDMSMFSVECSRLGIRFNVNGLHVIDPLVIDRHFERNVPIFTKPFMRLNQMAGRYGVLAPTHDALADCISTGYVAIAQSVHHTAIRRAELPDLVRSQQTWYEEWATKFISFAEKKDFIPRLPRWPFGDYVEEINGTMSPLF